MKQDIYYYIQQNNPELLKEAMNNGLKLYT